eukprot:8297729-Pyramimonas_sp.AAC.1
MLDQSGEGRGYIPTAWTNQARGTKLGGCGAGAAHRGGPRYRPRRRQRGRRLCRHSGATHVADEALNKPF